MLNLKISEELSNSFSKLGMKTYGNYLKLTDKASALIKAGQTSFLLLLYPPHFIGLPIHLLVHSLYIPSSYP
jgi:hypothetical protein